jgi:translation initiation factor 3 subunit A
MSLSKKPIKPQLLAAYYEKLTQMFWISKDYLYHALALLKLYKLSKTANALSKEQLQLYVLPACVCEPTDCCWR